MKDVQLVRLDPATEESLANDPAYMDAMVEDNWAQVADLVHRLVGRTLTAVPVSVDKLEWDGYFVVDTEMREVVGSCAFKGQPTEDGTVEIAYFTYPDFEGKGCDINGAQTRRAGSQLHSGQTGNCPYFARGKRLDAGAGESRNELCGRGDRSGEWPSVAMAKADQGMTN